MTQIKRIIGLAWTLYILTACTATDQGASNSAPMPVPTSHPFLNAESTPTDEQTEGSFDGASAAAGGAILNPSVAEGESGVVIAWVTSAHAIGSIAYGQTEQYEIGEMHDDLALTQHAFVLTGLEPETTYYYRITSVDSATNAASTLDGSFETVRQSPVIDVWYGLEQSFGQNGTPQRWVNILGRVFDTEGVSSLAYSLNGQPSQPLSIGPDMRRLAEAGDFNVDIARDDLLSGENEMLLTAVDILGNQAVVTVTINYENDTIWPGMYEIDWPLVSNVQDVVEVVDGLWDVDEEGIRTAEPGYNRMLVVGDVAWTDYEAAVPVIVHDVLFDEGSGGSPGLGFFARWTGHTDIPEAGWQPRIGWQPFGAIAWYRWDTPEMGFLRLEGMFNDVADMPVDLPALEQRYIFKLRVETLDNGESRYSFKVWPDEEPEPDDWDLVNEMRGLPNGSLALVAHQVDASFGDVTITQLAPPAPFPFLPDLTSLDSFNMLTLPLTGTIPITTTEPITESGSLPCSLCIASIPGAIRDTLLVKPAGFVADVPNVRLFAVRRLG